MHIFVDDGRNALPMYTRSWIAFAAAVVVVAVAVVYFCVFFFVLRLVVWLFFR